MMNVARRFNAVACGAVLVGSLTFCLADDRPMLALLTIPITIAGWLCGRGGGKDEIAGGEIRPISLPRTLVNLMVLAAIINAALRAGGARSVGQPIVSHLGEFLIYVELLKLFDRRTIRDESQLLTLSVFVAIAAVLTSNNLVTGLGLLIYTPLAIAATMMYQIRAGRARADEGRTPVGGDEIDADGGHWRVFGRQLTRTVWLSVLTAGFLGAIIFLVTPRGLGMGALGQFGQPHMTVGFDDHIDLGRAGLLSESATPVMDVAAQDEMGNNVGSPVKMLYLRGFAKDEYDLNSHIWVRSRPAFREFAFETNEKTVFPREQDERVSTNKLVQRITIRPSIAGDSYVFCAWKPLSVRTSDAVQGKLHYDLWDGTIKRDKGLHSTFTYTVESSMTEQQTGREPLTKLGFAEGRIHDLAVSILENKRIPYPPADDRATRRQIATAFREYLQQNCSYTLDLWPTEGNKDPLQTFLFSKKTGHCQYFASAFVAMCQSVGVHARVVGGFVAAEYSSITGTYLVRQSNAHAWAEYHLGDGAWATLDPTPAADMERLHRAAGGWLSSLRRWWDTLEFGWNRSIVSFDSSRQADTIGRSGDSAAISGWFARMSDRLTRGLSHGEVKALIPAWVFYIVPAFMLLVTLALVTGRLSKLRWVRALRRDRQARDPELQALLADAGFYSQALQALEKAGPGLAKPDDRPPLAHADAIEPHGGGVAEALRTISAAYYAARFGRRTLTTEQLRDARSALSRLKELLREGRSVARPNRA